MLERLRTDGLGIASVRGCRGDHARRSGHAPGGHLSGESSHGHYDEGWGTGGEENAAGGGRGHGRNRISMKRKEAYEPTAEGLVVSSTSVC